MSDMGMQSNGSDSGGIYNGAGVAADGTEATESGINNPQGRSVINAGEAGWAWRGSGYAGGSPAPLYAAGTGSSVQSRESVAMHSMGSGSSWRQKSGYSSPVPQAVAARIVDPSAHTSSEDFRGSGGGPWTISRNSLASASADYSPRHVSYYGSGRQDASGLRHSPLSQHHKYSQQQQQQQPTLAALALADSRGQLDSGLGYYYQQPPHVRPDFRGGQYGFSSEPASVAGSPVYLGSSSSARIPSGRAAGSVDNALFAKAGAMSPAASALGVVFPSSATAAITTTKTSDGAGQQSSGSSRRASRDSSLRPTDGGVRSLGTQREAVANRLSEGSDGIAHRHAQSGATHAQLSALTECGKNNRGQQQQQQHHQQRNHPGSADFTPQPSLPSTPSASAASLTAASSSFSFGNQRMYPHHQSSYSTSSQPAQQQPQFNALAGSNSHRHSTAASTNRDSMFLRFKEKMRHFKPRSRPQSDHIVDRRAAPGASQGLGSSAPHPGQLGSPLLKGSKGNSPDSESQLFGMPLECAVKVAGMRVGRLSGNDETCVVPTVVAVCGQHLWVHGQQTQGIFRVNGSMKRVQRLQEVFNTPPEYGRHAEWDGYTLHDAATMLRRYLTSLPVSVISPDHYSAFMDKLAETQPDDIKARDYGQMIKQLVPESRHTLLYMLELLSIFALPENSARTLMNSSNLAAVLQPCLLVHPGHVANPQEYSRAKDVVEFLIVHASTIYPNDAAEEGTSVSAGLVMFDAAGGDAADGQSLDGERCKIMASDDGTAIDPGCTETRGTSQPQQNRWSSTFTRESALTAAHSADSITAMQLHQQQQYLGSVSQPGSSAMAVMADGTTSAVCSKTPTPGARLLNTPSQLSLVAQPRQQQQQRNVSSSSMISPRGDSLASMEMVMSTPTMANSASGSTCGHQLRSLGSVTARLFDPTSPTHIDTAHNVNAEASDAIETRTQHFVGPYEDGQGHRSSAALSSIQYEHTKAKNRSMDIWSPPAARSRRSMSFVVTSPVQADDKESINDNADESINRRGADVIDESTQDIISRSSNAVHARRGAVERRAGHVNVDSTNTLYSADDDHTKWRPLPQIPQRTDSILPSPLAALTELPRSASEGGNQLNGESKLRRVAAIASSTTDPTGAGFQLYPRAQVVQPSHVITRAKTSVSPRMPAHQTIQSEYMDDLTIAANAHAPQNYQDAMDKYEAYSGSRSGVPHLMQAWTELPGSGSSTRAHWLSEDVPEDDYEFVGGKNLKRNGKAPATHVSDRDLHQAAQMAAAAVAASDSLQSQGLSDLQNQNQIRITHSDTIAMGHRDGSTPVKSVTAVPGRHMGIYAGHFTKPKTQRAVVSADGNKDKVSMTRLKNIFRMGHSSSSNSVGGSGGKGIGKLHVQSSVSSASREGEADGGAARFPVAISSPRLHPKGFQQQQRSEVRGYRSPSYNADSRVYDLPAESAHETVNRIQVAVPAGHLSIVYPDSPMSNTDTLRRSSAESYIKRMSVGAAAGSGHAYLVNPDASDEDDAADQSKAVDDYPSAYRGAALHTAPSNTTTLRSSTLMQPHQHQHHNTRRSRFYDGKSQDVNGRVGPRITQQQQQGYLPRTGMHMPYATVGSSMAPAPMGNALGGDSTGYLSSSTTFQTSRGAAGNVGKYDNSSSGMRQVYAMQRLADSDTQIDRRRLGDAYAPDGTEGGSHADAFVLPSISNGSPLLTGFEFGSPEMSSHNQQSRAHGLSRELYHQQQPQLAQPSTPLVTNDHGNNEDDMAGTNAELSTNNSPRRSRSLRNTITSLRRKMSRSSRNGAAGGSDATPTSMEELAQTASVH